MALRLVLILLIMHTIFMLTSIPGLDIGDSLSHLQLPWQEAIEALLALRERQPLEFSFHNDWHPDARRDRFPTVQQRVKIYMNNWYLPPCSAEGKLKYRIEEINSWPRIFISDSSNSTSVVEYDSIVDADKPILLHGDSIRDCARDIPFVDGMVDLPESLKLPTEERVPLRINLQSYCSEVVGLVDYMNALDLFTPKQDRKATPLIAQFGDHHPGITGPSVPIFGKWRAATSKADLAAVTNSDRQCWDGPRSPLKTTVHMYQGLSPIIWKLQVRRHWDPLELTRKKDIPWEQKRLGALWRGDFTGVHVQGTQEELCLGNQRCRFVLDHANSTLVDAGLTNGLGLLNTGNIRGTQVLKDRVTTKQIQQYKVIISMEGNDVASGLKWGLLSTSVVLMPAPTRTSWAMEELLEPWVHYIPVFSNGSNVEKRIRWVGENDEKARRIAERGRLFIYDLLYHPDAAREEMEVKAEIARRYRAFWQ